MRRLNLIGQKFWFWTVESFAGISKNGHSQWNCICECGKRQIVTGWNLKASYSKSCGCKTSEIIAASSTTHGMAKTPLHKIWLGIKNRCYNKNTVSYKNYGGRGIKVCDRWLDFENFFWDMQPTYKIGLTIERKDVNKNYEKENCIWIPKKDQSRNRTNTIWVTTELGIMTVTESAEKAEVSWFCMYNRHLRNCPIDKILAGPHKAGRSFTNV
jgi:hypothetical protein